MARQTGANVLWKSIQIVEVYITAGSSGTTTKTILPVDKDCCVCIPLIYGGYVAGGKHQRVWAKVTDSEELTVEWGDYHGHTYVGTSTIRIQVIELAVKPKRIQYVEKEILAAGTYTSTIIEVNLNKAAILTYMSLATDNYEAAPFLDFESSSSVEWVIAQTTNNTITVACAVVESH